MTKNHIIVSDPTIWQSGSAVSRQTQSVASLGLVSPGAATEGATPIFPEKKLTTFFRYHRLSLLQYHPYLFSPSSSDATGHSLYLTVFVSCKPAQMGSCQINDTQL